MISILLVTRNGACTLSRVLDAIAAQQVDDSVEIVAVDSGSSDGTADLLRARATRLIEVPAASFNHGLTRNLGVEACRGDLVVLLVQDAEPAGDRWLAALCAPLSRDPNVAATCARQIPRPDASAITRHYLASYAASSDAPREIAALTPRQFADLSPAERFATCTFDNVCSCIRRAIWESCPFPDTPIAEDLEWAKAVLLRGHRLVYAPDAVVFHSHERGPLYELRRTYLVHQRISELFDYQTVPTLSHLARAVAATLPRHLRLTMTGPTGPRSRAAEMARGVGLAFTFPLGQYLGARSTRSRRSARGQEA